MVATSRDSIYATSAVLTVSMTAGFSVNCRVSAVKPLVYLFVRHPEVVLSFARSLIAVQ
jgi:hypothetical protein